MAEEVPEIVVRRATVEDIDILHRLIVDSTGGKTRITPQSLMRDLFVEHDSTAFIANGVKYDDKSLEIDPMPLRRNKPVAQAIVAEANKKIVGYLIFHYYYSPWGGHCAFIEDIYTNPAYRRRGIARQLVRELWMAKERENLGKLMFRAGDLSSEMRDTISKLKPYWFRNHETDWSVCRILFEKC